MSVNYWQLGLISKTQLFLVFTIEHKTHPHPHVYTPVYLNIFKRST